jgi:hypothetical protein
MQEYDSLRISHSHEKIFLHQADTRVSAFYIKNTQSMTGCPLRHDHRSTLSFKRINCFF